MIQQNRISDHQYIAVRREFVLKVDGDRPILYPLDYVNTQIYFLKPLEGFALSLLQGDRPFSEIRRTFDLLFPGSHPDTFSDLISGVDRLVREQPSKTGIGTQGVIELSDKPITEAHKYDPREFVIAPADYKARMGDIKTRYRLDKPINIYTIFTHRCLTNCVYCYAERKSVPEMPITRWRELIQEIADLEIEMCSPDNGDTFARNDGIDLLECLIEHEMHFLLSTKASLSKEYVKRLIDAGFTRKIHGVIQRPVQLSIDAANEDVAKRMLGIPRPRTEKMVETFENFLSFGIMPVVKAVITGLNYDQPKLLVDRYYRRGARIFHFVRYHRSFHRHTDDLFVNEEHIPILKAQFDEIRAQYPDINLKENLTAGESGAGELLPEKRRQLWNNRLGCGGGWYALGIAPNGSAFLCEQMKMDDPFIVGDAQTQSIEEIWNSDRMARFIYPDREQFKGTICQTCSEFEPCIWEKGRCYRDAFFSYGSIYEPPPLCPNNPRPGLRLS